MEDAGWLWGRPLAEGERGGRLRRGDRDGAGGAGGPRVPALWGKRLEFLAG